MVKPRLPLRYHLPVRTTLYGYGRSIPERMNCLFGKRITFLALALLKKARNLRAKSYF